MLSVEKGVGGGGEGGRVCEGGEAGEGVRKWEGGSREGEGIPCVIIKTHHARRIPALDQH